MDASGKIDGNYLEIEECDLYRPRGFTTVALAHNEDIGRLCAVRKLDQNSQGQRVFFVEFYNTINTPYVTLEWKYLSQAEAFETVMWFEKFVIVGCSDGSLLMLSPFKCAPKSVKVCASPIVAAVVVSASQIAVASESSEIKLLDYDAEEGEFMIKKTIKFASDQRVVSLAASLKFSCLAVGMVDSITLVQLPSGQQSLIKVPQNGNKPTIVWTVLFVDDFLFSGTSSGKTIIHNPKTGALVKIINSHQADILAMVYDGRSVYVSGTDYRIQIISNITFANNPSVWNTTSQQIFHENDIRAMVRIGKDWLVSGGAEHRIFVSNRNFVVYNTISRPCCSVTENGKFIVMPYLNKLAVWQRPAQNAKVDCFGDVSIFTANSGPKALVDLIYDKQGTIVFETVISPNGRYLIESTSRGLFIHNMMIASDGRPKIENVLCIAKDDESPITALCSTNSALYFAHGSSVLERINFETLEREIVAIRKSDTMLIKITVNPLESHCLALTARSEILLLDLTAKNVDVDERFEKMDLPDILPADIKFHVTEDGDPMAIFTVCEKAGKLYFWNLKTKTEAKEHITAGKSMGERNIIASASDVVNNSMVLQETRGKCCIVGQLNEVQSVVFSMHVRSKNSKRKSVGKKVGDGPVKKSGKEEHAANRTVEEGNGNEMEVEDANSGDEFGEFFGTELSTFADQKTEEHMLNAKKARPILPPFPSESHLIVTDDGKATVLIITKQPEHPPTWVPINIRRFNR